MQAPIYLDYNATTPLAPEVAQAMQKAWQDAWGNSSSTHAYGRQAKDALERARAQVAALIGASPDTICFTSGGTEANNLAICGSLFHLGPQASLATSAFEHPATEEPANWLAKQGHQWVRVPCNSDGQTQWVEAKEPLQSVALITILHAHNETGVFQAVESIKPLFSSDAPLLHIDAAQTAGKAPIDVDALGADFLSLAAHKLYGPKGVGALYIRDQNSIKPWVRGAAHESGLRPGTENVPAIVGFGVACELAQAGLKAMQLQLQTLRDDFEIDLKSAFPEVQIHGQNAPRLVNTSFFSIPGVPTQDWLPHVPELAVSAGSACHADASASSAVLQAMGVDPALHHCTVRVSMGRSTTKDTLKHALQLMSQAIHRD